MKKRPISLNIAIVFFLLGGFNYGIYLLNYSVYPDIVALQTVGLGGLGLLLLALNFIASIAALYYLFKPEPLGYKITLGSLLFITLSELFGSFFIFSNFDLAIQAYISSQPSVSQKNLETIATMELVLALYIASFFLFAIFAFFIWKNRDYFLKVK